MRRALAALAGVAVLALAVPAAQAEGPSPSSIVGPPSGAPLSGAELEARTHEVASHVRCPVCQGLSVADSPSESARAMKDQVRDLVAQGYDQEQIVSYFEASYGEFIRLEPKAEGWNLLVWAAPITVILVGGGAVLWTVRGWRARAPAPEKPGVTAGDLGLVDPPDLLPYLERVRAVVGRGDA